MPSGLNISRLINVNVNLTAPPVTIPRFNTCLFLGTSAVIDTVTRMRAYASLAAVAADFGTAAEEYLGAQIYFAQVPQPSSLQIGRWVKTASAGQLLGAPLTTAQQAPSAWTGITTGSMRITIDGGVAQNLSALNFSAVANMNAVAAVIQAALTGATIVWNSVYSRFVVTSNTTGITSTVSFASATGTGTDISVQTGLASTVTGSFQAPGLAPESAITAVTLFDTNFASQWYGLVVPDAVSADHQAIAAFIEAGANKHIYGVTSNDPNTLVPNNLTSIAALLFTSAYQKSFVMYSVSSPYAAMSPLGRILPTNWNAQNSAITLFGKQMPGITPENFNLTQINALEAINANAYVSYNTIPASAIYEPGIDAGGQYTDTMIGIDWLVATLQANYYNLISTTPTKIPESDAGMQMIATVLESAFKAGVNNGLLAPGPWSGTGFGQLSPGGFLQKGYYLFTPPITTLTQAQRQGRQSTAFQAAVRMAGAVQSTSVTLNIGF